MTIRETFRKACSKSSIHLDKHHLEITLVPYKNIKSIFFSNICFINQKTNKTKSNNKSKFIHFKT